MTLKEFVDQRAEQINKIETASHLAWWNLATTGEERHAQELSKAKIALRTLFSSREDYRFLKSQPKSSDVRLNRQVTLLLHQYQENQISPEMIERISSLETEIEATYTNFRPVVNGRTLSNNDLKRVLAESLDSRERQEAWEASKAIGERVEQKVHTLISLRNTCAREAGFPDFYSMRLELQELDQTRLFQLLSELEQLTTPHWKRYKTQLDRSLSARYRVPLEELRPWHYYDPFFQEAPHQELDLDTFYRGRDLVALGRTFFGAIGMPVEDVLDRSDLLEREKKNQHAFCMCIDRKQDVRVLCNMRDNEYWMGVLLHELGHAVYDKYIDQSLPYLLRTFAHTSTTEASAMLFGRFGRNSGFLHEYVGLGDNKAQEIDQLVRQQTAASLLVFARWALVMVNFERAMYQQPDIDLKRFWWECVERFQGVRRVPERHQPDWASKLHLACAPVYYQNYVLGEMTASQLYHHLQRLLKERNEAFCSSPQVGNFLRTRLYHPGAQRPWEETLQFATGEPLNPRHFSQDVAAV